MAFINGPCQPIQPAKTIADMPHLKPRLTPDGFGSFLNKNNKRRPVATNTNTLSHKGGKVLHKSEISQFYLLHV